MKLKLKRLREIDVFLIVIIAAYAIDIGNTKYILAAVFIFFALTFNLLENESRRTKRHFISQFKWFLGGILTLLGITVIMQLQNGYASYAVNEAIYFLTPLLVVLTYTRHASNEDVERMLYNAFYVVIIAFLVKNITNVTVENLKKISFIKSSSAFESELAFVFLIFEIIFLYYKDKKRALIAFVFCFLSFKRLCLVMAVLFFVFEKWFDTNKRVSKATVIITSLAFIILPVLTCYFVQSDEWVRDVERTLGKSLDVLTNGRVERIRLVLKSDEIKYGLGSTTTYLTDVLNWMHGSNLLQRNLHNDLVRIYVECSIWGMAAYTITSFVATAHNRAVFILMAYLFLENYVNHLLGAGNVLIWILFYLFVAVGDVRRSGEYVMKKNRRVARIR